MADNDELVLHAPEGKLRPRRKQLTHAEKVQQMLQSKAASMRMLGAFCVAHARKWPFPYSLHAMPRDLKILKQLADSWGEEAVVDTIKLFFASTDPRVKNSNYAVTDFQYHAPRLRMAQAGGDVAEKTASNIHEISKAMGRKP